MTARPLRAAQAALLHDALHRDAGLLFLGESVGSDEGTGSTAGLPAERCLRTPLGDRAALNAALGLAHAGRAVVLELADARRLLPLAEPLQVAARLGAEGALAAPLVVRVPHGPDADWHGVPYLPGLATYAPTTPAEALGQLAAALRQPGPALLFEPLLWQQAPVEAPVEPGLRALQAGLGLTVLVVGSPSEAVLPALQQLGAAAFTASRVDLGGLDPVVDSVRRTERLLVVAPPRAAWGPVWLQALTERCFLHLDAPPRQVDPGGLLQAGRETLAY